MSDVLQFIGSYYPTFLNVLGKLRETVDLPLQLLTFIFVVSQWLSICPNVKTRTDMHKVTYEAFSWEKPIINS